MAPVRVSPLYCPLRRRSVAPMVPLSVIPRFGRLTHILAVQSAQEAGNRMHAVTARLRARMSYARVIGRWAIALGCVLGVVPQVVTAQTEPTAGARVRIRTTTFHGLVGTFIGKDADSLRLEITQPRTPTFTMAVPRAAITKLEVSTGTTAHPLRGFLIGAASGGLLGLLIDVANAVDDGFDGLGCAFADALAGSEGQSVDCPRNESLPVATLIGVSVGGLLGWNVGRKPRDRWVQVGLAPTVSAQWHAGRRGQAIGVHLQVGWALR